MALQALSEADLACIEETVADLPDYAPSMEGSTSSGYYAEKSSPYFGNHNIFTERGVAFVEGGEKTLRLKLQILQLIADLFPNGEIEESSIDKLGVGSFNAVIAVTLRPNAKRRDSVIALNEKVSNFFGIPPRSRDFALRIPLDEYGETMGPAYNYHPRDVATQHVISSRLALTIPKIEEYDLKSQNAMGRPYTLQTLLPGNILNWLWAELNIQQKVSAMQQTTEITEKIAAMTTPVAGLISMSNLTSGDSTIALDQFHVPTLKEAEKRPSFAQPSQRPSPHQTPCEYLVDHCERWREYEKAVANAFRNARLWDALIAIVNALDRRGWLGQHFHLAHGDLYPRNFLAEITSSTTVKITGVIDWDMACFAPKFVALRAPFWSWKGGFVDETTEDMGTYESPGGDYKLLKESFRRTASDEFIRYGLSREGAIARKLFKVVCGGMVNANQRFLALELVEQWDALYPEDRVGDFEVV